MADGKQTTQAAQAAPKAKGKSAAQASGPAQASGATQAFASAPALGLSLARRRRLAKVGLTVSLGALVVTAFTGAHKRGPSRALHLASGAALVGFSLWHHALYGKPAAKTRENDL